MANSVELVLRLDQRYGTQGQTIPPGTPVATVTFADGLPANLASLQFLGSALTQGVVVDGDQLRKRREQPKPYEPTPTPEDGEK